MKKVKLNFLLIGKTGGGKSATGNKLLDSSFFKVSSNFTSETKYVTFSFSKFENYELLVVDGPGLEDTTKTKVEDKIAAAKNMDKALAMCYGGVDAFLFVLKFGNRFTEEEKNTLEALKKIFGDGFKKHVIVVMTCGDQFRKAMEQEFRYISFEDWCREQNDENFHELYKECEGRVVLFNNREKDEGRKRAQIIKLIQLAESLQERHGRYTSHGFEIASCQRDRMIKEQRAPHLKATYQKQISLLVAEINKLSDQHSDINMIKRRIQEIRTKIDKENEGYGVLLDLRVTIDQVEEHLNDKERLIALTTDLEMIRQAKKTWSIIGTVCAVVSGVISIAALPIGLALAGGSAAVTGIGFLSFTYKEKKVEEELQKIKSNNFVMQT